MFMGVLLARVEIECCDACCKCVSRCRTPSTGLLMHIVWACTAASMFAGILLVFRARN